MLSIKVKVIKKSYEYMKLRYSFKIVISELSPFQGPEHLFVAHRRSARSAWHCPAARQHLSGILRADVGAASFVHAQPTDLDGKTFCNHKTKIETSMNFRPSL